jgi:hypothetical protein
MHQGIYIAHTKCGERYAPNRCGAEVFAFEEAHDALHVEASVEYPPILYL